MLMERREKSEGSYCNLLATKSHRVSTSDFLVFINLNVTVKSLSVYIELSDETEGEEIMHYDGNLFDFH